MSTRGYGNDHGDHAAPVARIVSLLLAAVSARAARGTGRTAVARGHDRSGDGNRGNEQGNENPSRHSASP